ncbi:hypothetical protein [Phyllobacterium myrsinacearum]|uniref:Uncharacterized protein n=1 Tax=Phyllobacterium myrsinacearum TaxID=28101 RepID=A0A839ERR2_9HYPH|nr:hypothetical protein [Phyllobacterium myrsinacearum]MBA8879127.1 hypothetical protein [Phyllobacterium myrsinacearum]
MVQTAKYRRLLPGHPIPPDAVRIRIFQERGTTVAEVEWPSNELTNAGDYFYATHVPLAFERALDVQENYGFKEIVVILDEPVSWDDKWGVLESE